MTDSKRPAATPEEIEKLFAGDAADMLADAKLRLKDYMEAQALRDGIDVPDSKVETAKAQLLLVQTMLMADCAAKFPRAPRDGVAEALASMGEMFRLSAQGALVAAQNAAGGKPDSPPPAKGAPG